MVFQEIKIKKECTNRSAESILTIVITDLGKFEQEICLSNIVSIEIENWLKI